MYKSLLTYVNKTLEESTSFRRFKKMRKNTSFLKKLF